MGKAWCFESAIYSHVLQDLSVQTDYGMCDANSLHLVYRYTSERALSPAWVRPTQVHLRKLRANRKSSCVRCLVTNSGPINHQLIAISVYLI